MAYLTYKHSSYYAIFSHRGKKKWIRIGNVSKPEAKKIIKRMELEYTTTTLFQEKKSISLHSFIVKYLIHSKNYKAQSTYNGEYNTLNLFLKFTSNIDLKDITGGIIEDYKSTRVELKAVSINLELAYIRAMLYRAKDYGYLDQVPKFRLLKVDKLPPKNLSPVDVKLLLKYASPYLKPMLVVMLNTGVRTQELLGLRFTDIDWKNLSIVVRSPKTKDYRIVPINKTLARTLRYLEKNYISPSSCKITARKPSHSNFIFCDYKGLQIKSIKTSFNSAASSAGIKVSPHSLRHTFATNLLSRGVDIVTVKELLGHKKLETTLIYTHSNNQLKVDAVNKL